jgi:hypothetical protein
MNWIIVLPGVSMIAAAGFCFGMVTNRATTRYGTTGFIVCLLLGLPIFAALILILAEVSKS